MTPSALSTSATKNFARNLATTMLAMEGETTLTYAQSFVARDLRTKGHDASPEAVSTVLKTGEARGYFRIFKSTVMAPLSAPTTVSAPVASQNQTLTFRKVMTMYWDDATLDEHCDLSDTSRAKLNTAITKIYLVTDGLVLDGTRTVKDVRRDVENRLEARFPEPERVTTSSYVGMVLKHVVLRAVKDGYDLFID